MPLSLQMTNWRNYVLCAVFLPLVCTQNSQRRYNTETTTTSGGQEAFGHIKMSEEHKINVGNRIEPVIFCLLYTSDAADE